MDLPEVGMEVRQTLYHQQVYLAIFQILVMGEMPRYYQVQVVLELLL